MRVVDIGVAAGYAVLCIALISMMSPYGADAAGVAAASDARASSAVARYVQDAGMQFLAASTRQELCASLMASGNATVILGGEMDGQACGPAPQRYLGSASISFTILGTQEVIEAWVVEG